MEVAATALGEREIDGAGVVVNPAEAGALKFGRIGSSLSAGRDIDANDALDFVDERSV